MARRTRGKRLAWGLLPAAATTAALAIGARPVGANTTTVSDTYLDDDGTQHTCTVHLTRTYPFNGDNQVGEGGTAVSGGPGCTEGVLAYIGAFWNDPGGEPLSTVEDSDGVSTSRRFAPVGDSFVTQHRIDFSGSPFGCSGGCVHLHNRTK